MSEVINPSSVPDGANIPPAEGTENVTPVASLKDIVKNLTGREYTSDEEAAKGIQNTYQMVGRKVEPQVIEKTIVPDDVVQKVAYMEHELKVSKFYKEHPEYLAAEKLISDFGGDPEQVVSKPGFQEAFTALKAVNESKNKSSLTSNSRIAIPEDKQADYSNDLENMRKGKLPVAEFMAKHKGYEMLSVE